MNNLNINKLVKLIEVIAKLRSPDGCPWDKEQTHLSLREHLLQESYEVIDAIESGDDENLKEELGDLLLHVVLHSQIANEDNRFNLCDVAEGITEKIIRRHPHVFGDLNVSTSEEVMERWDEIKKQEKPERKSAISGISKSQPALMTALQLSQKAIKVGFEWPNIDSLWDCLNSEIEEFKEAVEANDYDQMEEEFGDVLFSMVNVSRWHKIDPELALMRANKKFKQRFQLMEEISPKNLSECNLDELENLWQSAKDKIKNCN